MKKLYFLFIAPGVLFFVASAADAAAKPAYPSWSQQDNTTKRFTVLTAFGGAAVLDNETGLVWERSPDSSTFDWWDNQAHCNNRTVGNRKGWRLPTIQELTSLIAPNISNPALPAGHPFIGVQLSDYWSATNASLLSQFPQTLGIGAWAIFMGDGSLFNDLTTRKLLSWCVRGGSGVDSQ